MWIIKLFKNVKRFFYILLILLYSQVSQGQEVYQGVFKPFYTLELGTGTTHYVGDLVPWEALPTMAPKTVGMNFRLGVNRFFTPRISGKLIYQYSLLNGDENLYATIGKYDGNFHRNLHFQNTVQEIGILGAYHLQKTRSNILKRQRIRFQWIGGLSLIHHTPYARPSVSLATNNPQQKNWQNLRSVRTEGIDYANWTMAIPVGLSLQIKLSKQIDLGFTATLHYTFSDYIDDVSDARSSQKPSPLSEFYDRTLEPFGANTLQNRIPINSPKNAAVSNPGNDLYISTQIQFIFHLKKGNEFNQFNN